MLGHSQISLTMNTYTHVMPSVHQEAATSIEGPLGRREMMTGVGLTFGFTRKISRSYTYVFLQVRWRTATAIGESSLTLGRLLGGVAAVAGVTVGVRRHDVRSA